MKIIKIYNKLNINQQFLPKQYPEALKFLITGIDHTINNNTWETNLSTLSIPNIKPDENLDLTKVTTANEMFEAVKECLPVDIAIFSAAVADFRTEKKNFKIKKNNSELNIKLKEITKINSLLIKKLLSIYYKKEIIFKKPNDLLIDKKKNCGILQETLVKLYKKYLIVGIGINLIKNPNIKNYPTTNLHDLTKKKLSKSKIENELKKIFELKINKHYKSIS